MNRSKFIQGLNSNIELSDKERRRAIRNSINKRPWKLNCTIAMEEFAELTQQVSKQIRGYGDRIGLIEEMADAYICLKLLESIFNISPEDMQKAIDVKMDRERKKIVNRTTKINVLAYASRPEMDINYFGDIVEYQGKRYFVSLSEEVVEFRGIVKESGKVSDMENLEDRR